MEKGKKTVKRSSRRRYKKLKPENQVDDPQRPGKEPAAEPEMEPEEKRTIEEALRESEEKYSALVENSKDGIVIIQDRVLIFTNRACTEMVGYTPEEMIGTDFMEWVAPESLELVGERYAHRMAGKDVPGVYEIALIRKDGTTLPVEVSATLVDYEGTPTDLVFIRDITERKKAEKALQESEERLTAFMESAPDVFALLDPELNIVEINKVGLKTLFPFGTKRRDIKGKNIAELIPQLEGTGIYEECKRVIETERPFTTDKLVLRPKFGEQYLSLKAFKVGSDLGIIAHNITERKQMEEALRESEERLLSIFSSLEDLVFVLDKEGVFLDYFQPINLSDLYAPPREFLGKSYREVMPPKIVELMEKAEEELVATGEVQQFDYPLVIRGEELWFSAKVTMRRDITGEFAGYTMVARNITERKKTEEEFIRLATAMRMSADSIIICDLEGNILDVNEAALRLYGVNHKEDLIGKSSFDFVVPGTVDKTLTLMEKLLEIGFFKNQETEILLEDGRRRITESSAALLRDAEGNPIGSVGIHRDISERKLAEEELKKHRDHLEELIEERTIELRMEIAERKQAEEKLRKERDFSNNIIQASPTFFVAISADGKTMMMNEAILQALGYNAEEVVGTDYLTTFVPESDHEKLSEIFEKLVKTNEPTLNENHVLTKEGKELLVEWHGRPVFKENGEFDYFFGIGIDITDRRQSKQRLQKVRMRTPRKADKPSEEAE
ncbi:MAG: PAS domain S-box protein [Thermoplasmata archaeon]|nr:MAG: PAS domain S-box protein [Thermoplasmata archaeon]